MMKTISGVISLFCILLFAGFTNAQTLSPTIVFRENPKTHNMHLTSDGQFLYSCNGGKSEFGQISKFKTDGTKIGSYAIGIDMRSIMYNYADKKLYVYTYGRKLYMIIDLVEGSFSEVFDFSDRNEQCAPAMSTNGNLIYFLEFGSLYIYTMKNGKLKSTLSGLKTTDTAAEGGTTVAMDAKHCYSWDAGTQTVYINNLKGKFQKSVKLTQGDYGFSLSCANDLLWVSEDGNYEEGTWYGYEVK